LSFDFIISSGSCQKRGGQDAPLTLDGDSLVDRIDFPSLCLVNSDLPLLVTRDETGGLDDGSSFQGADGHGWEQRGEEEVVARRDEDLRKGNEIKR
jgi:hypothetical protein